MYPKVYYVALRVKMVVNVEKLLKMVIFQNLSKFGEMLKNVGDNIKIFYCTDLLLHSGY